LIGETGMARTGVRRCQIETGSRAPLKKFGPVRTRQREPERPQWIWFAGLSVLAGIGAIAVLQMVQLWRLTGH
jgi:hypothetical protein